MTQRLALFVLLALLAGCAAGPNYRKPDLPAGQQWVEAQEAKPGEAVPDEALSDAPWWLVLGDERLNALMDKALTANQEVAAALARIKQAQAGQNFAVAQLLPNSNGQVQVGQGEISSGYQFPVQNQLQANLNISWEIDFLGGNRRELEARTAEKQASYLGRDAVLLGMSVEVARTYVLLRSSAAQVKVVEGNIATQSEMLHLTTLRNQYGLSSALDVAQAARQVSATKAELFPLLALKAGAKHRLELLLGQAPGGLPELDDLAAGVQPPQTKLVLASPGAVLVRRPDVALAERALAAAVARQGVSRAAWLPRISLSYMLGTLSANPDNELFMSGQAFSLGGAVMQPLIDFGRIKSQIRVTDAKAEEKFANLQQTALKALSEVETALSAYFNAERRREELIDTEAKAADTLRLSRKLFLDGLGQFLNVLDAQRELLRAQMARTEADAEVVRAIVDLQSAMGGATFADKPLPTKVDPPLFQISLPEKLHSALSDPISRAGRTGAPQTTAGGHADA